MLKFYLKTNILVFAVTLIAVKREVAAQDAGFPWSECQEPRGLTNWRQVTVQASLPYGGESVNPKNSVWKAAEHTGKCTVTTCRTY